MQTYHFKTQPRIVGEMKHSLWSLLRRRFARLIDRERELLALRNVIGMMSEARHSDAMKYHEILQRLSKSQADANRFCWLAMDHESSETREMVVAICQSIPTRGIGGLRSDIDACMKKKTKAAT
jgi:hypothetical protein